MHTHFFNNRSLQRIAALTGLMLAGLTGLVGTAAAQTGPLLPNTVTEYPMPYHTPVFHSGGASTPYPLAGVDPLIDPLFPQLQGTATGYYPLPPGAGAVPTQIPSFLLGDYLPSTPPGAAGVYYPNHFADGNLFSWAAPFAFVPLNSGGFTLDDNEQINPITAGAGSVFTITNGPWTQVTTGNEAGTATNGEYYRLGPGSPPVGTVYGVAWKLTASSPGSYSVFFHIPDNIDDGNGNIETRNANVTYLITVTTATGVLNTAATASQTEANSSQFLAGPYQLQIGDTVTVTLERADNDPNIAPPIVAINDLKDANGNKGNYTLVADSMSLQTSTGDVQSTPTAINRTAYPNEFANLKYWGIAPNTGLTAGSVATVSTTGVLATDLAVNAAPDLAADGTTPILKSGDPALATASDNAEATPIPGTHLIRQLVYFGRSEPVTTNQASVDDNYSVANGFTPGNFTTVVNTGTGAATATNGEYRKVTATNAPGAPATWTLIAPNGGNYFVTVHLPGPTTIPAPETRITDARYTVTTSTGNTYGPFPVNQVTQSGNDVLLPTGPIPLQKNQTITVSLSTVTAAVPLGQVVVADSVRINTGTGTGAIYCVDGFTGSVVWRFETPGAANGPSAPVFSSPAIARINVLTPTGYQNKLVVVVGDSNGLVYCLDAIGNGDGTSNENVIDAHNPALPTDTGQPIYIPQPAYGTGPVFGGAATPPSQANIHVGTTGAYWIYRPDANRPKNIATGTPRVDSQGIPVLVPTSDLPTPAAFSTASPTIFVDPTVATATPTASNATVYVGNSNGVLYALDALGVAIDGTSAATFASTGDTFDVSQDLRVVPNIFPAVAADPVIPTCQPKWWFTLRGPSPNDPTNTSSADIESAPAVYVDTTTTPGSYLPHVYIGSAHEQESTSNVGRLYALNGLLGPSGNNGRSNPATQPNPAAANYTGPGSANYNVGQKPQTDAADARDWSFPDALNTVTGNTTSNPTYNFVHQSSSGLPRPALGNITGSPVVFTNILETANGGARQTRIYFAANVGVEIPNGSTTGVPDVRPDDTQTGRVWSVNLDGSVGTTVNSGGVLADQSNVWSYPRAYDPNNAVYDTGTAAVPHAEPYGPIGSFLHVTPAIGFVQFPTVINNGNGSTYAPTDAIYNAANPVGAIGLKGDVVPMLYVATRGVNDTALYAIDIDGEMTGAANGDTRTIYRQISPDGSIFQSSPVLIANATALGGNGGTVLLTAGNTLYDFSATPISNPITTQAYPLVREDRAYTGFGPISGPALAGADVSDLQGVGLASTVAGTIGTATGNVTDWVYVGDTDTGFCRGITPNDLSDASIPIQLGSIVPPAANPPGTVDLSSIIQTYLVPDNKAGSTAATDADPVGSTADLPVYEWGQNVYIRFKNVVPPNPNNTLALYVHDNGTDLTQASTANPITVYSNGGPIEFDLSDVDDSTDAQNGTSIAPVVDHGTVPSRLPTAANPLPNGFYPRTDTITVQNPADPTSNLVDAAGKGYIGAYTYAISDGSARRNTPGGRRQVINAHQTVMAYSYDGSNYTAGTPTTIVLSATATNGNEVTVNNGTAAAPSYGLKTIAPVDQPTFGILNPLGIRAGGIPLLLPNGVAAQIGDELGPFRPEPPTISATVASADTQIDLEALTNGNSVYLNHAPPSTAGVPSDPTKLVPLGSANSIIPPANPYTVVTSTPLIAHNHSGDNSDLTNIPNVPMGSGAAGDGLLTQNFGYPGAPYAANIFDRTPLGLLGGRSVSTKMNVPNNGDNTSGSGGLYWNDNAASVDGHNAVVNYLPWETAPGSYKLGSANSSPDYPDISPQNVVTTLHSTLTPTLNTPLIASDLQAGSGTLTPAMGSSTNIAGRTVTASFLQIHVTVPHYQPANQQVYVGNGTNYSPNGEVPPLNPTTGANNITTTTFPMGYVTTRRIFVPSRSGRYQTGAAYRDISIYTGVPIDMSTSIANPTTDIGTIPAAFGLQSEQYTPLGLFTPYNTNFQANFKPLEIHNDGNVNLLNIHLDQKINNLGVAGTLLMHSDAIDPLSSIAGYDLTPAGSNFGLTGPRTGTIIGTNSVPEEPFLIRSSVDTDVTAAYGPNPMLVPTGLYAGATFHKPTPGGNQSSTLTVPDSPTDAGSPYYLPASATGLPATGQTTPPLVSFAVPFGTPVGTYSTTAPQTATSLRLFEGLDTPTPTAPSYSLNNIFYPPKYGGSIGGIGTQTTASLSGSDLDIYNGIQPISTVGTQLSGTVLEQRLTDGYTVGAVPMIDAGSAGGTTATPLSTPDFAPAAFRDNAPGNATGAGNISVYWTSGRSGVYGISGANVPFTPDPQTAANTIGQGYFLPFTPTAQWWNPFTPISPVTGVTNSGLTITQDYNDPANIFAFVVSVDTTGTPAYNNTLFSYDVAPGTGLLSNPLPITNDSSQVKYGVRGLYTKTGFGANIPNLWAFWTASTRGRTAISYNSLGTNNAWIPATGTTTGLLPLPAGLTSVADPSPLLITAPNINPDGTFATTPASISVVEVTYSGTGPDGSVDLYTSRYLPTAPTAAAPATLALQLYPQVTEILKQGTGSGWYQARDVAWSRTGALNVSVGGTAILYDVNSNPLFTKATFDKASGLLVLTGVKVPDVTGVANATTTNTVYVDATTGRIRFVPALKTATTQNLPVQATFNPQAKRLTTDSRADTAPVTFLDDTLKPNAAGFNNANLPTGVTPIAPVTADRRWTIWRKSGTGGATSSATLYYKTQRLTLFLPKPILLDANGQPSNLKVTVNGTTFYDSAAPASELADVDTRGRIYFPILAGGTFTEDQTVAVTYTASDGTPETIMPDPANPIQWQDEAILNDAANLPTSTLAGLNTVLDYKVPIDTAVNENNVAAFLDPFASATSEHKVWLFWNSTRNGTADIYSETINPLF